jgi:hypothetical protein
MWNLALSHCFPIKTGVGTRLPQKIDRRWKFRIPNPQTRPLKNLTFNCALKIARAMARFDSEKAAGESGARMARGGIATRFCLRPKTALRGPA